MRPTTCLAALALAACATDDPPRRVPDATVEPAQLQDADKALPDPDDAYLSGTLSGDAWATASIVARSPGRLHFAWAEYHTADAGARAYYAQVEEDGSRQTLEISSTLADRSDARYYHSMAVRNGRVHIVLRRACDDLWEACNGAALELEEIEIDMETLAVTHRPVDPQSLTGGGDKGLVSVATGEDGSVHACYRATYEGATEDEVAYTWREAGSDTWTTEVMLVSGVRDRTQHHCSVTTTACDTGARVVFEDTDRGQHLVAGNPRHDVLTELASPGRRMVYPRMVSTSETLYLAWMEASVGESAFATMLGTCDIADGCVDARHWTVSRVSAPDERVAHPNLQASEDGTVAVFYGTEDDEAVLAIRCPGDTLWSTTTVGSPDSQNRVAFNSTALALDPDRAWAHVTWQEIAPDGTRRVRWDTVPTGCS